MRSVRAVRGGGPWAVRSVRLRVCWRVQVGAAGTMKSTLKSTVQTLEGAGIAMDVRVILMPPCVYH